MAELTRTINGGASYGTATKAHCPRVASVAGTVDYEDSPFCSVEVSVTAAEIKALRATNKELVAAPGAGKVLQFLGATLILDFATAYSENSASCNIAVNYTDASGAVASEVVEGTGFWDASSDQIRHVVPAIVSPVMVANAALTLDNNGAAELITGTGVLRVKVLYAVHTTGL